MDLHMDQVIKNLGINMKYIMTIFTSIFLLSCNENTFEISVDENLKDELIQIEVFSTENRQTQIVYSLNNIIPHTTVYGENDWKVTYDNREIFKYREFVLNRNDVANYEFKILKENNSIFVEMKINGANVSN